ncbi:hypothetical protein Fcan01_24136 [Folsomia candida]|uniref:Uncharacterized protein n=1 Tax=Folsomia candida TaxID=158441 RepID=A0A226D6N5_FOLCA|nr:hypothetical protein Fcan01_24136 [Folsomia candida]
MISTLNAPFPGVKFENWKHIIEDCDGVEFSKNISIWMNATGITKYWDDFIKVEVGILDKLENLLESKNCFRLLSPLEKRLVALWASLVNPAAIRNTLKIDLPSAAVPRFGTHIKKLVKKYRSIFRKEILPIAAFDGYIAELNEGRFEGGVTPEILLLSPKFGRDLTNLTDKKSTEQVDDLIRNEVLKCGKSVWISGSDEVSIELKYLARNYIRKRWQKGSDMLTPELLRLKFSAIDKSSVPRNFQGLIESGIWSRLKVEKSARDLSLRPKL